MLFRSIIGIAAVVSVLALGAGSRQMILADISAIGTSTIEIMPGSGFGDRRATAIRTLRPGDGDALATLSYVDSVTPSVAVDAPLRYRDIHVNATITGVGEQFFRVRGYGFAEGQPFSREALTRHAQEAVIDDRTRRRLFPGGAPALGQVVLLGQVPVRVVGVTADKGGAFGGDDSLNVWLPYTTAQSRILGSDELRSLTVRVSRSEERRVGKECPV